MKFKVVDKQNRVVLNEGRSRGMGFAFGKLEGDIVETVDPVSPCKDYINDRLYTEHTGKDYSACGLRTTKRDIFAKDYGYLVAKICGAGASRNESYPEMARDIKDLEDGRENAQTMMRSIEDQLKIEHLTMTYPSNDGHVVIEIPKWWCEATYRISLYTLIFRNGVCWDGKGSPIDFLSKRGGGDSYMLQTALMKLKRLIDGDIPSWDWTTISSPHGLGIVYFNWEPKK